MPGAGHPSTDCFVSRTLPHRNVLADRLGGVLQRMIIRHPGGMAASGLNQIAIDGQRRQAITGSLGIGLLDNLFFHFNQVGLRTISRFRGRRLDYSIALQLRTDLPTALQRVFQSS